MLVVLALNTRAAEEMPDFTLLDCNGRVHELHRAGGRAVVLFFTGNGCPIARKSVSKLRALPQQFGEDVTVWMVDAYSQDDPKDVRKEALDLKVGSIPILMDEKQGLALALGVQRTAEVVAISTKDWTVFYRGAIDDQLSEGAEKPQPTQKYLASALTAFLAGKEIPQARTSVKGCLIAYEKVSEPADGPVSYVKQVAPILREKCAGCHSEGNIGPFAFSSYSVAKKKARMIQEVLLTQRMPPWHADPHYGKFTNNPALTAAEVQTLGRWIAQGAPRDEGEDPLNAPVPVVGDWPLGKPDYIVRLPAPETVPATGVLDYRHIKLDSPIPDNAWLAGVSIKPGNRKVVHHVIVRAKYKNSGDDGSGQGAWIAGWAPGYQAERFPEGTGRFLGQGAKLDFEMHYTTMGVEQTDQTEIGLYVLPEKPKLSYQVHAAFNAEFSIPPGEADARTFATFGFKHDSLLYNLTPHMHLRGSWMRYEALYPNGKREVLLSVPRYDFNWQTTYRLAEPKRIPAGSWLLCTGGFDNSAQNHANPDPKKRVTWGDQSWDEMFIGFLGLTELPRETAVSQK